MNKRSKVSAVAALGIAAAAVGIGAVVSGNAMAGSGDPALDAATVTLIAPSPDGSGDYVECTLDLELPAGDGSAGVVWGEAVVPAASGTGEPQELGEVQGSYTVNSDGTVVGGDGSEIPIPVDEIAIAESVQGVSAVGVITPADAAGELEMIEVGDARQGTPEECAALGAGVPTP